MCVLVLADGCAPACGTERARVSQRGSLSCRHPLCRAEAPKPAPVVPAPEQPAMNPNVTQRVFNPNAKTFMEQFVKNGGLV